MAPFITEYPQFFTATNLEWKKLLTPDKYKDIIISSLRFLVNDKRANIFAFAIMENHIHLIWQMMPDNDPGAVQRDFLKYIAQRIQKDLQKNHPEVLAHFRADVGWYQIRKAIQARNASGDFAPVSFKAFEESYKALTEKLQPQVYELGFLKLQSW